ncbi:hypothetical protein [Ralstonia mannitolilytica]|uniref:hypothetical protein n=1 Tax=Ralstonia mannitolilytica TaxID=105219 RepID=UPI0028F6446A|nr:hypothetical protein [Ralstonia mannitolilytica]CAJ0740889.1 hypothetical protein R76696_03191 [Ralstonia mannitolilytica]
MLERIALPMEGYDKNQSGFEWRKGWNEALRYAMDCVPAVFAAAPTQTRAAH